MPSRRISQSARSLWSSVEKPHTHPHIKRCNVNVLMQYKGMWGHLLTKEEMLLCGCFLFCTVNYKNVYVAMVTSLFDVNCKLLCSFSFIPFYFWVISFRQTSVSHHQRQKLTLVGPFDQHRYIHGIWTTTKQDLGKKDLGQAMHTGRARFDAGHLRPSEAKAAAIWQSGFQQKETQRQEETTANTSLSGITNRCSQQAAQSTANAICTRWVAATTGLPILPYISAACLVPPLSKVLGAI